MPYYHILSFLPPRLLARALHELTESQHDSKHRVVHLRECFDASTPDTEWVCTLSREGGWVVITQDRLNKGLEREALRQAQLKVFLLDSSWSHQRFWDKARRLVRWWPRIIDQASGVSGGAMFRVPWNFSGNGKFKQLTF